ncbi:sigma-54 interaction domain-containing protein [Sporosarcina cyprini]|uniref:sigma-54 interaction domain-containing protein n=1 Tax=Sporosarcina cyprini TaxID=2910523 RepID=UPI001EE11673|nr:sigma 54-interacting transcriptional regulator [Sporosarcina cyprini]MCG3086606.1 sigma 54-interacting transcriptional regulator [Sporosarcina cyprini]
MIRDLEKFKRLSDFDNVLVVDNKGKTLYYDLADLNVLSKLGHRPEDFLGKKVTSFYTNLTDENSTIMTVLHTGEAMTRVHQKLVTKTGQTYDSLSSTYPIEENGVVVGAIEFSKHFYSKEHMHYLDHYSTHKIYRKNNTVYTIDDLITQNEGMKAIKEKIERIAQHDSTILIYGKTGTGKEIVAQAIHNRSNRFGQPFITLNCRALSEDRADQLLWGTEQDGETQIGIVEQANGGTLFLDGINELSPQLQAKLLQVIEEKTIRRLGGTTDIRLDVHLISSTNEDPETLLQEKRMREDFYYRIGVIQIDLPELKERKEDIELLVWQFIRFYQQHMNVAIEAVEPEVIQLFHQYSWPGNVRELKNAVETAINQMQAGVITVGDLPRKIRKHEISLDTPGDWKIMDLKEKVDEYERAIIAEELSKANGVIAETARRLGVSKQTLKYKLTKYELR